MQIDYLIGMANDINAFFASETDTNTAVTAIHFHLKRFWDPRMRSQIVAHYNEARGEGLEARALAAVKLLAAEAATQRTG